MRLHSKQLSPIQWRWRGFFRQWSELISIWTWYDEYVRIPSLFWNFELTWTIYNFISFLWICSWHFSPKKKHSKMVIFSKNFSFDGIWIPEIVCDIFHLLSSIHIHSSVVNLLVVYKTSIEVMRLLRWFYAKTGIRCSGWVLIHAKHLFSPSNVFEGEMICWFFLTDLLLFVMSKEVLKY